MIVIMLIELGNVDSSINKKTALPLAMTRGCARNAPCAVFHSWFWFKN